MRGTLTTNRNRTPRILLTAEVSLSLLLAGCTSSGWPEASAPSATEKTPAETSAETERGDDSTREVTYKYPEASDSNADPSGVAVSTFTWDEASQRVEHSGEFPPEEAAQAQRQQFPNT